VTLGPHVVLAEVRAQGTTPRPCATHDLRECERRVREALRRARARQWQRCHWWGIAREEEQPAG
jgi:hypothetical protein